jgi:hypothetical protein
VNTPCRLLVADARPVVVLPTFKARSSHSHGRAFFIPNPDFSCSRFKPRSVIGYTSPYRPLHIHVTASQSTLGRWWRAIRRQPAPGCGTSLGHLAAPLAVPEGDEDGSAEAVVRAAQASLHGPAAANAIIPRRCVERAKGRADSLSCGAPWADSFVPVPPHVGLSCSCRRTSPGFLGSTR